ncbi:hypothetical protein ADP71_31560 [Vitreoscilla sp. C1]|uniref:helix-turn-helix domain-containing protein n=1 Tax=Vitreoscilla sp. (strain C1) TaxID=96942 RepID=UPI000CDBCECF|nr:helix-turn-helix domain-containing protein [Vitreoscilla sp. C1]AUZ06334.1 hypothetical protein ADP71_31560 [Vitreoscilla sp. C1]
MSIKLMSQVWDLPRETLNQGQKLILLALCDYANDDGECYPSQYKLADRCSCTERAVRNHLAWFKELGVLDQSRRQKGGRRLSDFYVIDLSPLTTQNTQSEAENFSSKQKAKRKISTVEAENFSSSYISGTPNRTVKDIDIGAPVFSSSENQNPNTPPAIISADTNLTAEQVIGLMTAIGWKQDTYAHHPSLVASVELGVLQEDLSCALSKMQAHGAANWDYFCKTLKTTVAARIKDSQALPVPATANATETKRPERKRRDTTAADIDLLVAEGVAADLAAQWVTFRASRNIGMLTQAFLDELKRQGKLLGLDMDLNAVVDVCLKKSWCGFEAAWIVKAQDKQQAPQGVAYKPFEPEQPVPAETKRERFENGKSRAKELLALTKRVTAGK